jgi:hypothetical protein
MATTRPFAYNPSQTPISGATQIGDLAIGYPSVGFTNSGLQWWNGPDEELGYVVCKPIPLDNQPTSVPGDNLTLSTTYKGVDINLSNGNQTAFQQFGYQMSVLGETLISGGDKVMFSVLSTSLEPLTLPQSRFIGLGNTSMNYQGSPYGGYPGNDTNTGGTGSIGFNAIGQYYYNGSVVSSGLPTWSSGDIIDIAVDYDLTYVWIRVNGGYWNNNPVANPALEAGPIQLPGGSSQILDYYPVLCPGYEGTMKVLNIPKYGYPSGYNFLGKTTASVGFLRTSDFTDQSFINLVNSKFSQNFTNGLSASSWLNSNGYWTSWTGVSPVLSLDAANYTSGNWIDSIGGKQFTLYNNPNWSSSNGGYFNFTPASSQYAICNTSLPSLNNWTVGVWHFYIGSETGSAPCIVTETFIGGGINYSLGKNDGGFSSGFFDGGWRVTDGYSLTPGNWYYIVGTYDGSTVKLYVNSTLVDSTAYVGTPTTSGAGIRLMERWDLSDYWGGGLATVDIYDEALSNLEVASKWNLTKSRFGY